VPTSHIRTQIGPICVAYADYCSAVAGAPIGGSARSVQDQRRLRIVSTIWSSVPGEYLPAPPEQTARLSPHGSVCCCVLSGRHLTQR
jgi:hypothetical protein